MSFDTAGEKNYREDLVSLANPQGGVDALTAWFPLPSQCRVSPITKTWHLVQCRRSE